MYVRYDIFAVQNAGLLRMEEGRGMAEKCHATALYSLDFDSTVLECIVLFE